MEGSNVIKFPIENKRLDLSNVAIGPDEVAKQIKLIKLAYFSEVADQILDDQLRSMSCLRLEEGKIPINPVDQKDLILMKESIIATLCRMVDIEHPLHRLIDDNLVMVESFDGELDHVMAYKFKEDVKS